MCITSYSCEFNERSSVDLLPKIIFWSLYTFPFFAGVDDFRAFCEERIVTCLSIATETSSCLFDFSKALTSDLLLLVSTSCSLVCNRSAHHQGSAPV